MAPLSNLTLSIPGKMDFKEVGGGGGGVCWRYDFYVRTLTLVVSGGSGQSGCSTDIALITNLPSCLQQISTNSVVNS